MLIWFRRFSTLLYVLVLVGFAACDPSAKSLSLSNATKRALPVYDAAAVAKAILQDTELDRALDQAEALIQKEGLSAGGHYREVWIRDLNTFIETALRNGSRDSIKEALLTFFYFQGRDGSIVDGYVPAASAAENYNYLLSRHSPNLRGFKNTVASDQESSLVQAVYKYVTLTKDNSLLGKQVSGETVLGRLDRALKFLLQYRYSNAYGLIWGGTAVDWGDVQPEGEWGVVINEDTDRAIDIYDNAMFIIAIQNYVNLIGKNSPRGKNWIEVAKKLKANTRKFLWDADRKKFVPHVYLSKSPFPENFNERDIYFHGGTVVAIEAGILTRDEAIAAYSIIRNNAKKAGAATIGLTVFPPYPKGFFKNPLMKPYSYQNGGDWTWFGARWVRSLVEIGRSDLAYEEVRPMVKRVLKNSGFYEWYDLKNQPHGANNFKGEAGVLSEGIRSLKTWAQGQV